MTAEADFHAALDRDPGDGNARLALADWLDENAQFGPCQVCDGRGYTPCDDFACAYPAHDCSACRGSGTVSDGRRERAAGFRALAVTGQYPEIEAATGRFSARAKWSYLPDLLWAKLARVPRCGPDDPARGITAMSPHALPESWHEALRFGGVYLKTASCRDPRRAADDAAALAFGRLHADVQARILAGVTA